MDTITIKDLEVYGNHGVLKEENVLGQKFLITAVLYVDAAKAGDSDQLEDSVSYAEVAHEVNDFFKEHTYQLIEAVAQQLAYRILMKFPVEKVSIEVKKPWAPILLPLDTVSVKLERQWHTVYFSIGSNMGEKEKNLKDAVNMLDENPKIRVTKISDFLVTEPYGGVEQDDFLNAALEVKTLLTPREILAEIGKIEQALKRERLIHWGPRTIDLDILLYDDQVVREPDLCIPHIEMHKRQFVLEPLEQIAPQAVHPLLEKTVYQMLSELVKQ